MDDRLPHDWNDWWNQALFKDRPLRSIEDKKAAFEVYGPPSPLINFTRATQILNALEELASAGPVLLTSHEMASALSLTPTVKELEIDLLLRILLPTVEPYNKKNQWRLDQESINDLLRTRLDELTEQALDRGRELNKQPTEDPALWLFEELHALVNRLESRHFQTTHALDEVLDDLESRLAKNEGEFSAELTDRARAVDKLLRDGLYMFHHQARRLSKVRGLLGINLLLLLSPGKLPLQEAALTQDFARLLQFDQGLDRITQDLIKLYAA
jgi:hypothetical protein